MTTLITLFGILFVRIGIPLLILLGIGEVLSRRSNRTHNR